MNKVGTGGVGAGWIKDIRQMCTIPFEIPPFTTCVDMHCTLSDKLTSNINTNKVMKIQSANYHGISKWRLGWIVIHSENADHQKGMVRKHGFIDQKGCLTLRSFVLDDMVRYKRINWAIKIFSP